MTTHSLPMPVTTERRSRLLRVVGYGLLILALIALIAYFAHLYVVWPWMQTWGATEAEINALLPGDELVPEANLQTTKGVSVQATPAEIYPWLLQIGVERGGMYSYDWLENLFGLNVHTVDQIVPEYQNAQVGDFWRFTPKDYVLNPGLYVKELIKDEDVLLCFGMEGKPEDTCFDSWQFVLVPQPDGSTRLLLRSNMAIEPELPIKLTYFVQFLMEQKMLRTLRDRAEG